MASEDPPERDMKDFEFIQLCKFKVSQSSSEFPPNRSQLLASSSLFGLLFYAADEETPGFKVVKTSELLAIDQSKGKDRNKVTVTEFPIEAKVTLPGSVEFLGISADDLTLAVAVKDVGQLNVLFFDVRSFANKPTLVLPYAKSVVNANLNASVLDLGWNPTLATMLAICLSDGSLLLLEVTGQAKILASLPSSIGASCFSWSPKGKQILVGKRDGSLAQYDHSLAEKRQWPCPSVLTTPHTVVDVVWVSTYSFLAGYLTIGATASDQPIVVLTQSNKENNTKFINFDDPCFGNGEERKPHLLFHFVQKWEMVIMASSRASEATIIGKNLDDKVSWDHWNLDDCARAELPLTSNQNDSYPLGLAVDYSPQNQVVLSETKTLMPCPILFILSNDGLLLSYHLSYTHKDAPQVTTVPQALDPSAARKGVPGLISKAAQQSTSLPAPAPATTAPFGGIALSQPQAQQPQIPRSQHSPQAPSSSLPFANFPTPAAKPTFAFAGVNQTPKQGDFFPSGQKPPPAFGLSPSQPSQPSQVPPNATTPSFTFSMGAPVTSKGPSSAFVSLSPATASTSPRQAQATPVTTTTTSFGQPIPPMAGLQQQPSTVQGKPAAVPDAGVRNQPLPSGGAQQPLPSASAPFPGLFGLGKKPGDTQVEGKAPNVIPGHHNQNLPKTSSEMKTTTPPQGPRFPPPSAAPAPTSQPFSAVGNNPGILGAHPGIGAPPAYPSQQVDKGIAAQARDMGSSDVPHQREETKNAIRATVDSAFTQNITEEIADFELEMKELMNRSKKGLKAVGSTTELQSLRQDVEKMSNFVTEIKDATKEQVTESQDLKATCYNLLYLCEECNTLHQRNHDPHYHSLLQGRALDPVTAEKLKSLQQMAQSLESTVVDVDHVLDSQWNDHLNKEKEKMMTSAGDTIYKTIKNNHWLITDQRGRLEKLEEQIRCLRLQSKARKSEKGSHFKLLPDSLQTIDVKASPSSVKTPPNTMTPEKLTRLKDYLLQRKVPVVKPTTPADLSMSRIVSQSSKKTPSSTHLRMSPQQSGNTQQMKPQHQSTPPSRWLPSNVTQQHQQTPTGIPRDQLMLAKGNVPGASNTPAAQKVSGVPMMTGQPPKMGQMTPESAFLQRSGLPSQAPTAFSGVAYFKPPPQFPQTAIGQGILAGQHIPPEVQAAAEVLSTHMGHTMMPGGPLAHIPQFLSATAASGKPIAQQQQIKMQNMYEDITPTETDETNDDEDDDDYDEEDNGYEDEDEDEEDVGLRPGFDTGVSDPEAVFGGDEVSISSQSQHQIAASAATKNLFGGSEFTSQAVGSDQGIAKATTPPDTADGKPSLFTVPTFGSTTRPAFNVGSNVPVYASPTASPSIFSGKLTTSKPAFSFGGAATFVQKAPGMQTTPSGDTNIFGSLATPSKSVGFSDLASQDTKPAGQVKPALTVSQPSAAPKDVPDAGNKEGTTTMSASSLPFSSSTTISSPAAAACSSPLPAFSGESKDASAQPATGSTPLFGIQTKAPSDEATKSSPFAGQQAQTGFSIFGGNKAASPNGSKSGFEAVFSATSPTAKSTASGFSFSPNAHNLSGSGGLFGSEAATVSSTSTEASVSKGHTVDQMPSKTTAVAASTISAPSSTSAPSKEETLNSLSGAIQKPFGFAPTVAGATSPMAAATAPALGSLLAQSSPSTSDAAVTTAASGFTSGGVGPAPNVTSIFAGKSPVTVTSTTAASPFGSAAQTASPSMVAVFGSAAQTVNAPTGSPFGNVAQTTTASTASSLGHDTQATTASTASLIGNATQTTTALPFGTAAVSATQSATNFGTAASSFTFGNQSTTTAFGGIFGTTSSIAASSGSTPLFGGTTSSTSAPSFGSAASNPNSTSLFSSGVDSTTTSSTPSLFSSSYFESNPSFGPPTTTATAGFGGAGQFSTTTTVTSISSPLFGGTSTTSAPSVPSFGFDGSSQASGGGLFGASPSTSVMSSAEGGNLFSKPAGGGLFGASSATGSLFGQVPTDSASQSGSVFGQPSSGASTLGFGQSGQGTSLFGGSGEGFGLGGKPSEEKAKQNVFGSATQTFGSENLEQNSLFGSGGSSSFGTLGMGTSFSNTSGGFSSGARSGVSSTGFGVSTSPGTSSGFGTAPTFGGTPTFGTSGFGSGSFGGSKPTFGSGPSFGAGSSFGTTPSFSSPGPSGVFGSAASENTGFGSFASASAPSFGQLAQSSSTNAFGGSEGGFGSSQTPVFGSAGGGGGGSGGGTFGSFGNSSVFGQASPGPAFGPGQSAAFGGSSFGSSPAFSSYRG